MTCPMYVARCRQCGNSRRTYNDPRLQRSVIECKAACYESHYEWDFVEECMVVEEEKSAGKGGGVLVGHAEANGVSLSFSSSTKASTTGETAGTTSTKKRRKGVPLKRCTVA